MALSSAFGFSIQYPSSWKISDNINSLVVFAPRGINATVLFIDVRSTTESLDEILTNVINELPSGQVGVSPVTIGGRTARDETCLRYNEKGIKRLKHI